MLVDELSAGTRLNEQLAMGSEDHKRLGTIELPQAGTYLVSADALFVGDSTAIDHALKLNLWLDRPGASPVHSLETEYGTCVATAVLEESFSATCQTQVLVNVPEATTLELNTQGYFSLTPEEFDVFQGEFWSMVDANVSALKLS